MSRRYDMGEQDTTLLSLPKIALITLNPKKTQFAGLFIGLLVLGDSRNIWQVCQAR